MHKNGKLKYKIYNYTKHIKYIYIMRFNFVRNTYYNLNILIYQCY